MQPVSVYYTGLRLIILLSEISSFLCGIGRFYMPDCTHIWPERQLPHEEFREGRARLGEGRVGTTDCIYVYVCISVVLMCQTRFLLPVSHQLCIILIIKPHVFLESHAFSSELHSLSERAGVAVKPGTDSLEQVLEQTNLNWGVEKAQAYSPEGDEIPNLFLLRRDDTRDVLNVVKGRYQPVNNLDMFQPFDELVKLHGATYEGAGVVSRGGTCWLSE